MEKEIAKIIIFSSIFESTKKEGFNGLSSPLELVGVDISMLSKFFDIDAKSDYTYLTKFNSIPEKYTFELAGITGNFNIDDQKEWFKNYISNPNSYVRYTLGKYLNSLDMNKALKNRLDKEFLTCLYTATGLSTSEIHDDKSYKYNQKFTNKEFQDLIFISQCETIYNPEIEDKINRRFAVSNETFWNRFYELYTDVFKKKFGESYIINDSFFDNKKIQNQIKEWGFEILDVGLDENVYPTYPSRFLPYFNMDDNTYKNKKSDPYYIKFREEEFELYNSLCNKYGITPLRKEMM